MWDSDWSWQARSTTVSTLCPLLLLHLSSSSSPAPHNQEIVEVCFFIPLVATPFAGVDALSFVADFPRYCCCFFFFLIKFHRFDFLKPGLSSEVSQTCLRGEDLHSGRTMRWVKRHKSLHLHCVFQTTFWCFRLLVSQRRLVNADPETPLWGLPCTLFAPPPHMLPAHIIAFLVQKQLVCGFCGGGGGFEPQGHARWDFVAGFF